MSHKTHRKAELVGIKLVAVGEILSFGITQVSDNFVMTPVLWGKKPTAKEVAKNLDRFEKGDRTIVRCAILAMGKSAFKTELIKWFYAHGKASAKKKCNRGFTLNRSGA